MELFISILESVGILLGLGTLGFYIIGKRIIPGNVLGMISPLVLDIALPCLIFVNILKKFTLNEFANWWRLPLWWLFFTATAITLTLAAMFISQKGTRREFAISLFYQNGIFFPLAVITGLYGTGSTHLVTLFLFISFHPALFFSTYHLFFRGAGEHKVDWRKIVHPVLIMTGLALLIRLADIQDFIPDFIVSQLTLIGGMTLPLIMIILGGNIYLDFQARGRYHFMETVKFVLVKNFLFPLVFLGVLLLIRPPYHIALIIFLQSAVPPISAIPIVTQRCGGDAGIVNQFIFSSYLVLLVSIPLMVSLFSRFFPSP